MIDLYKKLEHKIEVSEKAKRIVKEEKKKLKPHIDASTKASRDVRNAREYIKKQESKDKIKL